MADAVNVSTIQDGGRTAIFYLTNTSDGTGEDAVTKIDVSALAASADGDACTGVRIQKIVFSCSERFWHDSKPFWGKHIYPTHFTHSNHPSRMC